MSPDIPPVMRPSSTPAVCFLDRPVDVCDGRVVTHHLTKMWRSAGEPLPADANGLIQPRKTVGTVCAVTGEPSPEYAFDDALSANFVTPRFHQIAFPYAAESRITLGGGREVPALSRAACWAIRSLAFRSATWVFDGERIEFAPMAPFATGERQKIEPEKMREAFGGRSSTDYLDWLLRPRPVGTVAALPLYGIDHGGEQNFHRLPWPSGCTVDPLVKLQSKHTVMHVRPTTEAGVLRLQVDDGLCIALDVETWARVAGEAGELLTEVLGMLPEKSRLLGVARQIIQRGPTAAREAEIVRAVGDFHRRNIQRVRSPFWPILVRALYPRGVK